jgi:uncharacterized protein (DUF1778 family)
MSKKRNGAKMANNRSALLVRCSAEEAEAIRQAAHHERRTIRGFILNAVLKRIANQKRIEVVRREENGGRVARAARFGGELD